MKLAGKYKIKRINNRYRIVYVRDCKALLAFAALLVLLFALIGSTRLSGFNKTMDAEIIKQGASEQLEEGGETGKAVKGGSEEDDEGSRISRLRDVLIEQLGKPYAYAMEGPDSFDCSGLVRFVYRQIGIELPRVAKDQAEAGKAVDQSSLRFGDILFFSEHSGDITHTGIYTGHGYMVHAPKPGDVVKLERIDTEYFKKTFVKAIRVI